MVPLKYLSNFRRILEIPLFNWKLVFSWNGLKIAGSVTNQVPTLTITDTKRYVSVVTLSAQDNVKLLKYLESGFKRTINWNKYQSKKANQTQNKYFDFLIDPSFQGVNRIFVLSFKDEDV